MRLAKEEYNYTICALKDYKTNFENAQLILYDILNLDSISNGEGRSSGQISDIVANKVIQLDSNIELRHYILEFIAVEKALEYVSQDAKDIFNYLFKQNKSKWETMEKYHLSARTFERRKQELVYTTYKELKKINKVKSMGIYTKYFMKEIGEILAKFPIKKVL